MPFTLRWFQSEAVGSIYQYYASGATGNPIVALPTGTGKSVVIAEFLRGILQNWPFQRVMCLTHVKELIDQNSKKMLDHWPEAPVGIYSAGLNQRDVGFPIVFGGVASVANCIEKFGHRDLLIVDECHLISGKENSNYGKVIAGLKAINPLLKVIGLTATKYRLGQGLLTEGEDRLFTDVCYDLTDLNGFNRLLDEGWIVPLIPKRTNMELNTTDVKIQAGDFVQSQLQEAIDKDSITYAACKEMLQYGANRRSWLNFCAGVEHSEHVAACLRTMGIDAVAVHSKMGNAERDKAIAAFKSGDLRCICNNNVLTTGFDHPGIDFIGMLRPTVSTGLWVQMLGRGTRPSPDTHKENCLVLDFAGNTAKLGPINDPVIPRKRKKGEIGVAPVRICEACGTYNHARATHCIGCGAEFKFAPKIQTFASTQELIKRVQDPPVLEMFPVNRVIYNRYQKPNSVPVMKVSYFCGLRMFHEYIALENSGYAGRIAKEWWLQRIGSMPPKSVDEALKYVTSLKVPQQIKVVINRKNPEIVGAIWQ
jgi:DNA repair protein RadD